MKKFLLCLPLLLLFFTIDLKAQSNETIQAEQTSINDGFYSNYKYVFGTPIKAKGPKISGFLSGTLSFFIPGLGQFCNGDIANGCIYMGVNVATNLWKFSAQNNGKDASAQLLIGYAVNALAVINAVVVARRVNIARGYVKKKERAQLDISPTILSSGNMFNVNKSDYATGVNLSLRF